MRPQTETEMKKQEVLIEATVMQVLEDTRHGTLERVGNALELVWMVISQNLLPLPQHFLLQLTSFLCTAFLPICQCQFSEARKRGPIVRAAYPNSFIASLYFPSLLRKSPTHSMISANFIVCTDLILSNGIKTWLI